MSESQPTTDFLETTAEHIKKHGAWKTFLHQIQTHWPSFLLAFIVVLGNAWTQLEIKNGIKQEVKQTVNFVLNEKGIIDDSQLRESEGKDRNGGDVQGKTTMFDPAEWIIEKFSKDDQDYYCPKAKGFKYWSMWSKKKIPPSAGLIKVKVNLKPVGKKATESPTFVISYGEYVTNKSPTTLYQIKFFDSDTKSVRLYNEKNESLEQDWLKNEPDLGNEILITLSPILADPNGRKLILNPELIYKPKESDTPQSFKSAKEFFTYLPGVSLSDGSTKKQLAIGAANNVCFKIESIEF